MVEPTARHGESRARGPEVQEADAALEDQADAYRFELWVQDIQVGTKQNVDRWANKPALRPEFGQLAGGAKVHLPETRNREPPNCVKQIRATWGTTQGRGECVHGGCAMTRSP